MTVCTIIIGKAGILPQRKEKKIMRKKLMTWLLAFAYDIHCGRARAGGPRRSSRTLCAACIRSFFRGNRTPPVLPTGAMR